MIKPTDIEDDDWAVITAAADGDVAAMRYLLDRDPALSHKGYFYTPPIHFAVREGHSEIVQMLLDAGADSEWNGHYGESLIDMAKERGHDGVASILEKTRTRRGRTPASETREDHAIHVAAERGDLRRVRGTAGFGSCAPQSRRQSRRHASSSRGPGTLACGR